MEMPHYPIALDIAGQQVQLHGLLEALGIFTAFRYYVWLRRKEGDAIRYEHRVWIIIAATLGALLGARIIGSLEDLPAWLSAPHQLAYFWGNKTLVGGLLGGLAGVELVKKIIREQARSGDLFVFPLLLGMFIGRIGCFTAGIYEETYGVPAQLPWAMDLGDGVLRHPVVLYEMGFLTMLMIALKYIRKRVSLDSGAVFKMFMISYLLFRFCLDFIKPGWRYFIGLGTIQLACVAGLLYYIRYLVQPRLLLATSAVHAP